MGLLYKKQQEGGPKHPPKSHIANVLRRTQIRRVIWRSSIETTRLGNSPENHLGKQAMKKSPFKKFLMISVGRLQPPLLPDASA